MEIYIVTLDGDDMPEEPVTANDCAHAADIYIQEILGGRACVQPLEVKRAPCVWVSKFEAPEGSGLMKETISTSIPVKAIPSWKAYLDNKRGAAAPEPF
jgi:hypothetical protein